MALYKCCIIIIIIITQGDDGRAFEGATSLSKSDEYPRRLGRHMNSDSWLVYTLNT